MNICLVGFVCQPNGATEAGIAWNWALGYTELGHQVTVLTHNSQKSFFGLSEDSSSCIHSFNGIKIIFIGSEIIKPVAPTSLKSMSRMFRSYSKWQKLASNEILNQKFDFIHHVSWSTCRSKSTFLSRPETVIWGPLGGGHFAKIRNVPTKDKIYELFRNWSIQFSKLAYFGNRLSTRSNVIALATNTATYSYLKSIGLEDVRYELADGIQKLLPSKPWKEFPSDRPIKLIWAGRVIASKRPDLAVAVLEELQTIGFNARLTFLGIGNFLPNLLEKIADSEHRSRIHVLGQVTWEESVHAIANSDFLVFTSVRDSSCPAVLEAASFGVPTLGLRINGLEDFFPNTFVLGPTKLVDNRSFASEIAEQLVQFLKSDGWNSCHDNAVIFAESHLWTIKASRLIEMVISK